MIQSDKKNKLYNIGCIGKIHSFSETTDGRYLISLQCTNCFKVKKELEKKYNSLGLELGDKIFCKEFQKDNFFKAYRLYQITDKVDSLFKSDNTVFNNARFSAINLIEKSKKLKNQISDFAMGVS